MELIQPNFDHCSPFCTLFHQWFGSWLKFKLMITHHLYWISKKSIVEKSFKVVKSRSKIIWSLSMRRHFHLTLIRNAFKSATLIGMHLGSSFFIFLLLVSRIMAIDSKMWGFSVITKWSRWPNRGASLSQHNKSVTKESPIGLFFTVHFAL